MKCTLPAENIRTVSKAINALSKIGDELYMEFLPNSLCLRAVSASKSAFGSFIFKPDFFTCFENEFSNQKRNKDPRTRFRLHMRSVLPFLKNIHYGEKVLESLEIEADTKESRIRFKFIRKSEVIHIHSVGLLDCEILQTAYSRRYTKSTVIAPARLLTETLEHFPQASVDEVSLKFETDDFTISNYTGDAPDPKQTSYISFKLDIDEFEQYEIDQETTLTCTLKELKGIVSFTSTLTYNSDMFGLTALPIKLYFTKPGVPLLLYIESPSEYEASFVIATMEAPPSQLVIPSQPHPIIPRQNGNQLVVPPASGATSVVGDARVAGPSTRPAPLVRGVTVGSDSASSLREEIPVSKLNFDSIEYDDNTNDHQEPNLAAASGELEQGAGITPSMQFGSADQNQNAGGSANVIQARVPSGLLFAAASSQRDSQVVRLVLAPDTDDEEEEN